MPGRTLLPVSALHWLSALLLCLALSGCRNAAPPPPILLIVADTLRADALGTYGAPLGSTPQLDRLARESLVFTRAYSVSSWTLPAIAALFTGRTPSTYRPGAVSYIDPSVLTLAEALKKRGYVSAALVTNPAMAPELGFERGFALYRGFGKWQRSPGPPRFDKTRAGELTDAAVAWLRTRDPQQPWFLYVHYMDPHWPYLPDLSHLRAFWKGDLPTPEAIESINLQVRERTYTRPILALARELYRGAVAELDVHLGRLIAEATRHTRGRVTIVVVSDHGEEFGDHGDVLHARTLFEEMIRIPLLVRLPERRHGIVPHPVSITQIPSTLWEAAGLGASPFPAPSLLSTPASQTLRAELFPVPPAVHARAVIDGPWKLILAREGTPLLYHLEDDPQEQRDRAGTETTTVARLRALLPDSASPGAPPPLSPEDRERMRALGYDF